MNWTTLAVRGASSVSVDSAGIREPGAALTVMTDHLLGWAHALTSARANPHPRSQPAPTVLRTAVGGDVLELVGA